MISEAQEDLVVYQLLEKLGIWRLTPEVVHFTNEKAGRFFLLSN